MCVCRINTLQPGMSREYNILPQESARDRYSNKRMHVNQRVGTQLQSAMNHVNNRMFNNVQKRKGLIPIRIKRQTKWWSNECVLAQGTAL